MLKFLMFMFENAHVWESPSFLFKVLILKKRKEKVMGEVLEIEEWNQRIKSVFNNQGKEYEKWEMVDSWVKSRGERL